MNMNNSATVELNDKDFAGRITQSWPHLERWLQNINPNPNSNSNSNVGESKKNDDHSKQRYIWGQLFICNNCCINLREPVFMGNRSVFLKTNFALLRKVARKISRNHFVLKLQHMVNGLNTVRITDLSSRGTFVNGRKIGKNETITLFDDDVVSIVHPRYELFRFKDLSNKRRP